MATNPAEALRALRRQLVVTAAVGFALGREPDAEIVKVRHEIDDDALDEDLDPSPRRASLEFMRDDDGRSL